MQSGIPNIVLAQPPVNRVIEHTLVAAINDGLDELVVDTIAASDNQAPGSDNILISIRKSVTTLLAAGHSPDVVALTPAVDEAIDVMVSGLSGGTADFVFGAGQAAPGQLFGLRRVVSKSIAAPVVLASKAYSKLYVSPVSLSAHEENAGVTNTSTVRMECHAACAVERQDAAVRIAAS